MLSAKDVADYILWKSKEDDELAITNLKLQKLLYYCQGFHLALFDRPLFGEAISKWTHGPVVPSIYHEFKGYGSNQISPPDKDIDIEKYDSDAKELIDEVCEVFGQFSGPGLRNMTHREPPWMDAIDGGEISLKSMADYFKTRVNK